MILGYLDSWNVTSGKTRPMEFWYGGNTAAVRAVILLLFSSSLRKSPPWRHRMWLVGNSEGGVADTKTKKTME